MSKIRLFARFGNDETRRLRDSLSALVGRFDLELPDYLPVLGYGLIAPVYRGEGSGNASSLHLPALISKVLLAFTIEFERESDLSPAICANIIRLLDETGVRIRDLPHLGVVSKAAMKVSIAFLEKRGYLAVEQDTKLARLTAKDLKAQADFGTLLDTLPITPWCCTAADFPMVPDVVI